MISPLDAAYAIGSGSHGHSYLAMRDGGYVVPDARLVGTREKQIWDLSPGFNESLAAGRPIQSDCLFCHTNHTEPVEGTVNRYREPVFDGLAIGCERCHGPGEKHVAARRNQEPVAGDVDFTIVNPGHLDPPLREAVCEQCHLAGRGARPAPGPAGQRLPARAAPGGVPDGVRPRCRRGRDNKAVNHVEQMHASRCSRERRRQEARLRLVPRPARPRRPSRKSAWPITARAASPATRSRVAPCRTRSGCKTSPQDSCIDCHMPRQALGNIPHTAATDHRIVRFRRREEEPPAARSRPVPALPVVPFHPPADAPLGPEMERDLGVGPAGTAAARGRDRRPGLQRGGPPPSRGGRGPRPRGLGRLGGQGERTASPGAGRARRWPPCRRCWPRPRAGRRRWLRAASRWPRTSTSCEPALDYWRRAAEVNPWTASYRQSLCALLAHKKDWDELRPHAEAWLRLDPASIGTPQTWVTYLLRTGRKDEARTEFAKIRALPGEPRQAPGVVRRRNALNRGWPGRDFGKIPAGNVAGFCIAGSGYKRPHSWILKNFAKSCAFLLDCAVPAGYLLWLN